MELNTLEPGALPANVRVLVTGAGGFLGTPCCDRLADLGVEVHGVSRRPAAELQRDERRSKLSWHRGDLLDPAAARKLVEEVRPTHLLHLAWASGADGFKNSAENYRWIGPSLELLRAFAEAGGKRVVCVGTGAEYEWSGGICREGETPLRPALTYGLCKKTFFELASRFWDQHDLSGAWARLFFLYGPREEARRLVASVVLDLLRGETARCGYSRLRRDYLYIEDAAEGLVQLLFSKIQGPIHIASGEAPTLGQLVQRAAERAGRADAVELGELPEQPGPDSTVVADVSRARDELGWRPRWTLDEGLDRTIDWWRADRQEASHG